MIGNTRYKILIGLSIILLACINIKTSGAGDLLIEKPSQKQLNLVKSVLDKGLIVKESAAVKSSKHKSAYYIGINFYAPGVKDKMTGIWLIGGTKNNPNLLYSVNGFAYQFSGMRRASKTKAAAYVFDKESKLILKYLE